MTPDGRLRLEAEAGRLGEERSRLVSRLRAGGGPDLRTELARVEQRLNYLRQSLRSAEVVAPPDPPHDTVKFGAEVVVRERDGSETRYRIVGADETEAGECNVSFFSPIARALLNARVGDKVAFKRPRGSTELEVLSVSYPSSE